MVCKNPLPDGQMSSVDQAVKWSRELTQWRSRGPGDLPNAMRAIEREYGIDYWFLWALRYRPARFRDIRHNLFVKLAAAWEAERARQHHRLEHETSVARHIAGPDHPAVRAAETMVGHAPSAPSVPKAFWEE